MGASAALPLTSVATSLPNAPLHLAFSALEDALERLDAAGEDYARTYAAVGEVLWWAVAVDEPMEDYRPGYEALRAEDKDGRLLPGLRWARNRVSHQRAILFRQESQGPAGLVWVRVEDVPPGRTERGRDIYKEQLAGEPIIDTIGQVRRWFYGDARVLLSLDDLRSD